MWVANSFLTEQDLEGEIQSKVKVWDWPVSLNGTGTYSVCCPVQNRLIVAPFPYAMYIPWNVFGMSHEVTISVMKLHRLNSSHLEHRLLSICRQVITLWR
jgi:hypothetical protein